MPPPAVFGTDQRHGRRQSLLDAPVGGRRSISTPHWLAATRAAVSTIGSGILSEQRSFGPESLCESRIGSEVRARRQPRGLGTRTCFTCAASTCRSTYLSSSQQNNPLEYLFFTQNAADGENFGWKRRAVTASAPNWQFSGSAAAVAYTLSGVGGVFTSLDIDGRAQPFAPGYEFSAGIEYHEPGGWFARLDSHALDSFYYYTSDAQTSHSYHLENLRIGYRRGAWTGKCLGAQSVRCALRPAGLLFWPDTAELSEPVPFCSRGDPRQIGPRSVTICPCA